MTSTSGRVPRGRGRAVATGMSLAGIAGVAVAFVDQGASVAARHSTQPTVTNNPGSATAVDPGENDDGGGAANAVVTPRTVTRAS